MSVQTTTTRKPTARDFDKPHQKVVRHTRQPQLAWAQACHKAQSEGREIGPVITKLLEGYVSGTIKV